MKDFWEERYKNQAFVYGESPNVFFAEILITLTPGKIILPCDGEGRNAVFAAKMGWDTYAFDLSEAGKKKALLLASNAGVEVDFQVEDAMHINYPENQAAVVALIYAHLPPLIRQALHKKVFSWLKPGGKLILEAFNPLQLNNHSGGPKTIDMLYTKDMLNADFSALQIDYIEDVEIELSEGDFHKGRAEVIRLIATK
jgi:SAM-dependent methyltransferase